MSSNYKLLMMEKPNAPCELAMPLHFKYKQVYTKAKMSKDVARTYCQIHLYPCRKQNLCLLHIVTINQNGPTSSIDLEVEHSAVSDARLSYI